MLAGLARGMMVGWWHITSKNIGAAGHTSTLFPALMCAYRIVLTKQDNKEETWKKEIFKENSIKINIV